MNRRDFLKKAGLTPLAIPGLGLVFDGELKPDMTAPAPLPEEQPEIRLVATYTPQLVDPVLYTSASGVFSGSSMLMSGYYPGPFTKSNKSD